MLVGVHGPAAHTANTGGASARGRFRGAALAGQEAQARTNLAPAHHRPEHHVELRPDSHNPEHEPRRIDLAKHILHIDGVAVGALIGRLGNACQ